MSGGRWRDGDPPSSRGAAERTQAGRDCYRIRDYLETVNNGAIPDEIERDTGILVGTNQPRLAQIWQWGWTARAAHGFSLKTGIFQMITRRGFRTNSPQMINWIYKPDDPLFDGWTVIWDSIGPNSESGFIWVKNIERIEFMRKII